MSDPAACALRELWEETGLTPDDIDNLRLRYITTRLAGDEIRQQYIFFATLRTKKPQLTPCGAGQLHWIPITELFNRRMGLSNTQCLTHYLSREPDDTVYHCAATEEDGRLVFCLTALREYSAER
jgi:8-oxo-dGTP diphosphatase